VVQVVLVIVRAQIEAQLREDLVVVVGINTVLVVMERRDRVLREEYLVQVIHTELAGAEQVKWEEILMIVIIHVKEEMDYKV
jgi:hypothetical protein